MSERVLWNRLRLALGAFVLGGFVGAGGGAVLGTCFGLVVGMPERGLDGALVGALLASGSGAVAASLMPGRMAVVDRWGGWRGGRQPSQCGEAATTLSGERS